MTPQEILHQIALRQQRIYELQEDIANLQAMGDKEILAQALKDREGIEGLGTQDVVNFAPKPTLVSDLIKQAVEDRGTGEFEL